MPSRSMHRKSRPAQRVKWTLTIPAELAAVIEHAMWSETYGKPIYGKRNQLVVALLQEWADKNTGEVPRALALPSPST